MDVAAAILAEERRRRPGLHRVGGDRLDEFILKPVQIVRRLDDDPRETDRRRGYVIIFERLELP